MTNDEALKLALEALEEAWYHVGTFQPTEKAIDLYDEARAAIKEALAQPEQCQCPNCRVTLHASDCAVHSGPAYPAGGCDCGAQPEQEPVAWEQFYPDIGKPQIAFNAEVIRYVAPQRTWVGLTNEEIDKTLRVYEQDYGWISFAKAIEAKLKEKNT